MFKGNSKPIDNNGMKVLKGWCSLKEGPNSRKVERICSSVTFIKPQKLTMNYMDVFQSILGYFKWLIPKCRYVGEVWETMTSLPVRAQ